MSQWSVSHKRPAEHWDLNITKMALGDPRGVRPRLEGKPRTPLSSRIATRFSWSPLSGLKGVQPPLPFGETSEQGWSSSTQRDLPGTEGLLCSG